MTSHLEESIIIGTRLMSGSEAIKFKNLCMISAPSSMPSSMLMSMICAPLSTCSRATSSACSNLPSLISFKNLAEPVTLVRSPTLTNRDCASIVSGSKPAKRQATGISGKTRGLCLSTASRITRICSGVLPQQPPIILSIPSRAQSSITFAMSSGVSS